MAICCLWIFAALPLVVRAASLDCAQARTPQEKAVCADPKLSKLDEDVAAASRELRARLSPESAAELADDERAWLIWLPKVCPASLFKKQADLVGCLSRDYADQLALLRDGPVHIGGLQFFPRLRVLTAPDTTPPSEGSVDPGFGEGRFRWPEIDRPTPEQAAWNKVMRAEVVWFSTGVPRREQKVFDFEDKSVADENDSDSWTIRAANAHFISISFVPDSYAYGAMHGNGGTRFFAWWLDRNRKLEAGDVFKANSGWEACLGNAAYAKLKRDHGPELFQDDSAPSGAADGVKDIQAWALDRDGLSITFEQHSVGPYSSGEFAVRFGWEQLRPYLADDFHPESLPPASPAQEGKK